MNKIKLGVVGLGTVGSSCIKLITENLSLLKSRTGSDLEIVGISARNKVAKRQFDVSKYKWFDNPVDMIEEIDVLVELIGGADGIALQLTKTALSKGVAVVTANKAMIAHHGYDLAVLAEENNASLLFEASVAGTVPVIEAARQGLSANNISGFYGILNGTCNFILSQMRETGRDFPEVLKEAQDMGYAEADPSFDVDGVDAGHKVAILAAMCFGSRPDFNGVTMTGIADLSQVDSDLGVDLGYKIKLIGSARKLDGRILQTVEPCFVPVDCPFSSIENAYNAVMFDCDYSESPMMSGLGAGGDATASAVIQDVIAIARGNKNYTFGVPAPALTKNKRIDPSEVCSRFYMRFSVIDKVGVMADISSILRDHNISIETMFQIGSGSDDEVYVALITHDTLREDVDAARDLIARLNVVSGEPSIIRIEDKL